MPKRTAAWLANLAIPLRINRSALADPRKRAIIKARLARIREEKRAWSGLRAMPKGTAEELQQIVFRAYGIEQRARKQAGKIARRK